MKTKPTILLIILYKIVFLFISFIYVLFFTVNIESTIMIYKYIIKNNKNKKHPTIHFMVI